MSVLQMRTGDDVRGALRIGLVSVKANFVPMVVLWGVVLTLVLSYYFVPGAVWLLEPIGRWQSEYGWRSAFLNRSVFCVIIPGLFILPIKSLRPNRPCAVLLGQAVWAGICGIVTDWMFTLNEVWFGAGTDLLTLVQKTIVVQFAWTPVFFIPVGAVETIMWATYCGGWWHNRMVEGKGLKTQQYAKLQRVNAELRRLGSDYMRFRNMATFLVGNAGTNDWFSASGRLPVKTFEDEAFRRLCADDGGPLVVGSMVSRNGNCDRAAFVFAADDPYDLMPKDRRVSFRCEGRSVRVFGTEGPVEPVRAPDGTYSIVLKSNAAALIVGEWSSKRAW